MLVASPLDLQKNELRQPQIHNLASAPGSPVKGQLYFNSTANELYYWDGTIWQSAKSGAGSSGPPSGPAGGSLTGTYPNPVIAALAVVDGMVATANKDGAVATPSMRTLGLGAAQAMPGNTRLDQVPVPNGDVNLNSQRIINLFNPASALDAANKQYVDGVAQGLDAKQSVLCASTAQVALTGLAAIDGITPAAGDRVLLKAQTAPAENGIYTAASGAWTRAADADAWTELPGAYVFVERGTVNADNGFICTVDQGGTLGTTPVTFTQFSGAGQIIDGAALLKTGNTLDVQVDGTTISVVADKLQFATGAITTAGGARYYTTATHGAGTTITITQATHGCRASRGLIVQTRLEATGEEIVTDNTVAANGDVTVTFAVSQGANTARVTVIG